MASIYYEQYQLDIHAQKEARIKQNMTVNEFYSVRSCL